MSKIEQNNRVLDNHELFFTKDGFCAIDISKDLKFLGFNEWCFGQRSYRNPEGGMIKRNCRNDDYGIDPYCGEEIMLCAVPMHQQVQKWLREKWNIFVTVDLEFNMSEHEEGKPYSAWSYYRWKAWWCHDCEKTDLVVSDVYDMTYEEAIDHGIRSCIDEVMKTTAIMNFTGVIQTEE